MLSTLPGNLEVFHTYFAHKYSYMFSVVIANGLKSIINIHHVLKITPLTRLNIV